MNLFFLKKDTWQEVYHALSNNTFRTFLTMIGVGWAMFLFVGLLGVVNGIQNGFDRDLKGTSTNSMFIWSQRTSMPYKGFGRGRTFELKLDDIDALKNEFPQLKMISPRNRRNSRVVHNASYGDYMILGDFPKINKMFKKEIVKGRFISPKDIEQKKKVCILGEDLVKDIYNKKEKVVGSSVVINEIVFTVVGVYKRANNGFEGGNSVFLPYTTFAKIYKQGNRVGWMALNVSDKYDIKEMENRCKDFLKKRHQVHPEDTRAFGSFNLGEMFGKILNFVLGLQFLATSVGFLTLTAGVLAISSILLITVKERTKEFGIRRALGALPQQIIAQILLESTVITVFSGTMGVSLATIVLFIVNKKVELDTESKIPLVNCSVDIQTLIISFALVILMSLLAALLPAIRAISIKPIDALRDE